MAAVTCIGGPLNGRAVDVADDLVALNVIDDSRLGVLRLVTYRVDFATDSARVVAESDI